MDSDEVEDIPIGPAQSNEIQVEEESETLQSEEGNEEHTIKYEDETEGADDSEVENVELSKKDKKTEETHLDLENGEFQLEEKAVIRKHCRNGPKIEEEEEKEEEEEEVKEEIDGEGLSEIMLPNNQFTSFWDSLDQVRRQSNSKASHNLFSPENSRTLLFLRQKSFVTIFESLGIGAILEEFDLQLELLGHAFPGAFAPSDATDFQSYDERFSRETKERELTNLAVLKHFKDPFFKDQSTLGTPEERLARKLQKDRAFLQEIVTLTKEEMITERSFEKLKNHVRREDNRRHEEATLLERMEKAHLELKKFRHRMTEYEAQMERHEQNRNEMIRELRDQLHQEKMRGKMDVRYARSWHMAQNRVHYEMLKSDAEVAKLRLKDVEIQLTRDRMAHKNIEAWSELRVEEIRTLIQNWTQKFTDDREGIEIRIHLKNEDLKTQEIIIKRLHVSIDERMMELGPYEEEKVRQRQERIAYLRLYYSARKIQRWWRAYMKKHNLYKKKKKKGKKAGK